MGLNEDKAKGQAESRDLRVRGKVVLEVPLVEDVALSFLNDEEYTE